MPPRDRRPRQATEIVSDHHHGEAEAPLQPPDQPVERRRADWIEARGRFIQEQDLRIQRERASETGALAHATGQLGGKLVAGVVRQADQVQLEAGQLLQQPFRQTQALPPWRLDVLGDRQRAEQSATLEQHSLPRLQLVPLTRAQPPDVMSEHLDLAELGRSSPRMWRNRTDLPAPEPPTTPRISP